MIHYTNEKRIIKLPRRAYQLLLEKVFENVTIWNVSQKEPLYKGDNRYFTFNDVVYVEEDESHQNSTSKWFNHE